MSAMLVISLLLCMAYAIFLGYLGMGWQRSAFLQQESKAIQSFQEVTGISVIVPCRNEENNIITCLDSIVANMSSIPAEIIVVNDHSEDQTAARVSEWINAHPQLSVRLISAEATATGKKAALEAGIDQAVYDTILTTDADCTHTPLWLKTIKADFDVNGLVALFGPVKLQGQGAFANLQIIESAGLVAMGAATLAMGMPTTSNGANLMFSRKAFQAAGGYNSHKYLASGDDEFLMHTLHRLYPDKIRFCHNNNAMVYTKAADTLPEFMQQRIRWASKGRHYSNNSIILLQAILPLLLISMLYNAIAGLWYPLLLQLIIKCFADAVYFHKIKPFFGIERLSAYNCLMTFYQYYCIPVALLSITGKYRWKGRRTN